MNGLSGICPTCGASHYAWALLNPENQKCGRCGTALEIEGDGVLVRPVSLTLTERHIESLKTGATGKTCQ
jgi:uncharacterized protein (DUF983 family)